ncbi:hypothetical protein HF521_011241 [Silurus meridionalis]|uniref:Uncharacterized protein n=1 Tax=Silurus meridionalis TaxID=175797 RepID=A0A8T0AHA2_SILME|nr:hypothetical protein HF521_011241 [Silurus meridionalis]
MRVTSQGASSTLQPVHTHISFSEKLKSVINGFQPFGARQQRVQKRKAEADDDPKSPASAATSSDDKPIAKKFKHEAEQEEELQKLKPHPEERYIKNAAVLPEFRPRPAAFASSAPLRKSNAASLRETPLKIHNLSIPEHQRLYHSVVDMMLVKLNGEPHVYSMQLGLRIKQRLWRALKCPSIIESRQLYKNEQTYYSEIFSIPSKTSFAPCYIVDVSEEPMPEQPERKSEKT